MTSSDGFQQHFGIISKYVCCGFYIKTAIWVSGSDTSSVASRARTELTSSKCEPSRI